MKYLLFTFLILLAATVVCPQLDLIVSGLFYNTSKEFFLANQPILLLLHDLASRGSWVLGAALAIFTLIAALRREAILTLDAKAWLFLLLALLIGPGLIANMGFKDHWGRARPNQVTEFGGSENFSPAIAPQPVKHNNGSFIAGDAAFGFFLPSFAFVIPPKQGSSRSRKFFWGGMAAGAVFGLTRLVMGAHFLSDILFAAFFILIATAALHAWMYGIRSTKRYWQEWL